MGTSASSDGQFFPTARHGEAMNMVNAKYGSVPGLKAYTHVSDQFAPFACQSIPATVSEAPYILDGLLMNEVVAMFANSMPIQQDSPTICSEPVACSATISFCESGICHRSGCTYLIPIRPQELRKLVGGKAREDLIVANWPDI
jgi:hypothetical protein